jgi:aryl-alcohol dehydrogenase-like predicted oxidoreductase
MARLVPLGETVKLGRSGLQVTKVGFGAWALGGGDWEFGWGPQEERDSIEAIERALELGVNWIDTAAAYGFGRSERVVGKAVANAPTKPLVFTKCSLLDDGQGRVRHCLKRDSIRREAEESLARLGVEAIDLYQIHWPIPEEEIEEGWETLVELREEGLLRHIGVSNFDVKQLERVGAIAPVETLQPPYSLIDRRIEREILPYCREQEIGVIVYSPMGSGLLTGKITAERVAALPDNDWRKRDPRFREPQLARHLEVVERLKPIARELGVAVGTVAFSWTLHHPAVHGAIVGFRRPEQVEELLSQGIVLLDEEELAAIEGRAPQPV